MFEHRRGEKKRGVGDLRGHEGQMGTQEDTDVKAFEPRFENQRERGVRKGRNGTTKRHRGVSRVSPGENRKPASSNEVGRAT